MARVYATLADLIGYAPAGTVLPGEPEATRVLTSASKVIDRACLAAVYQTDTAGYPTDTIIRQAFKDACTAQVVWWAATLDELGLSGQWQQISIGSVTLGRGSSKTGGTAAVTGQQLAPQADTELRVSAVLPGSLVQIQTWEGSWL